MSAHLHLARRGGGGAPVTLAEGELDRAGLALEDLDPAQAGGRTEEEDELVDLAAVGPRAGSRAVAAGPAPGRRPAGVGITRAGTRDRRRLAQARANLWPTRSSTARNP